jgi:thiol-disulfide isomerase/thioredoxin
MANTTTLRAKTIMVAVVALAIVASIGIGIYSYTKSSSSSSNTNVVAAQKEDIPKAPNFNLKTVDGKQVSLQSFKGKPLVLWFMATWCTSCVDSASAIKQVKSQYNDKLNVLVIDLWSTQSIGGSSAQGLNAETEKDLQDFLAKFGSPQWNAALDTDKATIKYGINQVDSMVLVDGNGNIVFKNLGPPGYQLLKDAVSKVVV